MERVKMNTADRRIKEQNKFRWIMKGNWKKLTRGEKVARVIIKMFHYGLITTGVIAIGSVVIGAVIGIAVAIGIVGAIAGGFGNASRANTNRFYGNYKW